MSDEELEKLEKQKKLDSEKRNQLNDAAKVFGDDEQAMWDWIDSANKVYTTEYQDPTREKDRIKKQKMIEETREEIRRKSKLKQEKIAKKNKIKKQIEKIIPYALAIALAVGIISLANQNNKSNKTVERLEQEYAMIAEDAGVITLGDNNPITYEDVNLNDIELTENYKENLENLPNTSDLTVEYIADETLAIAGKNSGLNEVQTKDIALDNLSLNDPDCQGKDRTHAIVKYDLIHGEPDVVKKMIDTAAENHLTIEGLLTSKGRGAK